MSDFDPEGLPVASDIVNTYRVALGRDPEDESIVRERSGQRNGIWLPPFFHSDEFRQKVFDRLLTGGTLSGGHFDVQPPRALLTWAADFLPLSIEGRTRLTAAADWYELFLTLFADPLFVAVIYPDDIAGRDVFLATAAGKHQLASQSNIAGDVERFSRSEVIGWAVDRSDPDRVLQLELTFGDEVVASACTLQYRHDMQARFGGSGHVGYRINYHLPFDSDTPVMGTVRDAQSQVAVGSFRLMSTRPPRDEVAQIRAEMEIMRRLLQGIEARLPELNSAATYPLDRYSAYQAAYPEPGSISTVSPASEIALVADARGMDGPELESLLAASAGQDHPFAGIAMLGAADDDLLLLQNLIADWKDRLPCPVTLTVKQVDERLATALRRTVSSITTAYLLYTPRGMVPAFSASGAFSRVLSRGSALAYADDHRRAPVALPGSYIDPRLRSAFDLDRLLQQDELNTAVAMPAELFVDSLDESAGEAVLYDLTLRISERVSPDRITHIPRFLAERLGADDRHVDLSELRNAAASALRRGTHDALAEPPAAALFTPQAHARVRYSPPPKTRVAVIIPTRDRLDLLEPCIASIERSRASNRSEIEVIVVDNRSTNSSTIAYLERLGRTSRVRVLAHDAPFNWSLINNRAATQTDADVLVFLNNDTAVIALDSWDELAGQAMRPEVGAVGAKLFYGDGTIQHAGVVLEEGASFSSHEAMGAAGSDAGLNGRHMLVHRTTAVTGACLATRRILFLDCGGFDAVNLPFEGNDTDYCLRLGAMGLRVLYDPFACFYHFESQTRGYNRDAESRSRADQAGEMLRLRWRDRYPVDPYYNPRFDRASAPFKRLRPLA